MGTNYTWNDKERISSETLRLFLVVEMEGTGYTTSHITCHKSCSETQV